MSWKRKTAFAKADPSERRSGGCGQGAPERS